MKSEKYYCFLHYHNEITNSVYLSHYNNGRKYDCNKRSQNVPTESISELERMQKAFLWPSKPKIKNETLCSDFKQGGLKNVNILKKIISLQCSWVKRLYDDSFHEPKVIPLKLIKKSFGSHFKFHCNLLFNICCINDFPSFHLDIFVTGKNIS